MNHEELLAKIDDVGHSVEYGHGIETSRIVKQLSALRAVVKLHYEHIGGAERAVYCYECTRHYPCPTIQAIEKELV